MYKFTTKIRSKKSEYSIVKSDNLKDYIIQNPVCYEVLISGNYIPYYEFDFKYSTDTERCDKYDTDLHTSYDSVVDTYTGKDTKIYSFCSSGYDPVKKCYKNSFHYRIRGAGFYNNACDIPSVEGMDASVYRKQNARQLMRAPYATKEGNNRPLLRIIPSDKKKYNINEIDEINEDINDYIIQNIDNENEVKVSNTNNIISKKDEAIKFEPQTSASIANIRLLCDCLNEERFNDRKHWLRFIRCLKTIGLNHKIDMLDIAKEYSKKSTKYNEEEVYEFFNRIEDDDIDKPLSLGSLCFWAKNDNPDKYSEILIDDMKQKISKMTTLINKASSQTRSYSFSDYGKFVNIKIDEYEIVKYLTDTIIHIIDGGNHKIFTLNVLYDGSIKYNQITQPMALFSYMNDFTFYTDKGECKISNYFREYYHIKSYNQIDFIPYLAINPTPPSVFNLFQGFKYKFNRHSNYISSMDIIFEHIKQVICSDNDKLYDYVIKYIAHIFQSPNEKCGVAILLQSNEQGTGKNLFTDLLMKIIGNDNCYKAGKIGDICGQFNAHLQGKLLIVGDEIANYTSHKFSDILKSLITEIVKSITPKGKDSYIINSFERYIFTSNNDFPFRVDKGDRRLLAINVNSKRKGDTEYFKKLSDAINDPITQEAFFNHMASIDISGWDFRDIPQTKMKSDLALESLDNSIHFVISEISKINKTMKCEALYSMYKKYCDENGYKSCSSRKFTKDLESVGIIKIRKSISNIRVLLYTTDISVVENNLRDILKDDTFKLDIYDTGDNDEPYDTDDNEA